MGERPPGEGIERRAVLDAATWRMIERHFRFDPARDRFRHPMPPLIVEDNSWEMGIDPAEWR
ncbi:hypothetical protein [uncultured Sphingomonas sp.]|uniref:hypothetical protein n=1 Tax=uncultured Sphingomonas sp. TaxID=158754 RepID=UPI0025D81379|nr:hypothetical protein [uncultured Sphingomonas sp.]